MSKLHMKAIIIALAASLPLAHAQSNLAQAGAPAAAPQLLTAQRAAPPAAEPAPAYSPAAATAPAAKPASKPGKSVKRSTKAAPKSVAKPSIAETAVEAKKVDPVLDAYRQWVARSPFKPRVEQGVMRFPYGEMEPTIICAELRVCLLELRDDEAVQFIAVGDPNSWEVTPIEQGKREVISIKPKAADTETNLTVATDRRTYSVALKGTKGDYVSRYGFYYPGESVKSYAGQFKTKGEVEKPVEVAPPVPQKSAYQADFESTLPAETAKTVEYALKGETAFKPVRVYSDGSKTFIQMPATISSTELPALFILDNRGNLGMPTPRYNAAKKMFVVDFVIEKAVLMLGSGREAQKVDITQIPQTPTSKG